MLEARPIRSYAQDGSVLWRIPSRLNPLEAGKLGDLRGPEGIVNPPAGGLRFSRERAVA